MLLGLIEYVYGISLYLDEEALVYDIDEADIKKWL